MFVFLYFDIARVYSAEIVSTNIKVNKISISEKCNSSILRKVEWI